MTSAPGNNPYNTSNTNYHGQAYPNFSFPHVQYPPSPNVGFEPVEPLSNPPSEPVKTDETKSKKKKKIVLKREIKPSSLAEQKAFLKKYDFMVLIDKSRSMGFEDDKKNTPWKIVNEDLINIVTEATKYDKNGIDVGFFSDDVVWFSQIESEVKVNELFKKNKPEGGTALDLAIKSACKMHFERLQKNPNQRTIILIITDGAPDNEQDAENEIIHFSKQIPKNKIFTYKKGENQVKKTVTLGIRFFQVGNNGAAAKYLKSLDNKLLEKGAAVDMVDTGNINELTSTKDVRKALVNAIYG